MRPSIAVMTFLTITTAARPALAQSASEELDQSWIHVCPGAIPGTPFYERCQEILNAGPGSGDRRSEAATGNNLEISGAAGRVIREHEDEERFELYEGRCNLFISGSGGWELRNQTSLEDGFDASHQRVVAGVDYLVSGTVVGGVGLTYSTHGVDFEAGVGRLQSHRYSATSFWSVSLFPSVVFDAHFGYAFTDYGATRNIDYVIVLNRGLPNQESRRITSQATANVRGHQVAAGGDLTLDLPVGPVALQPHAGVGLLSSWIDPYTELDGVGLALSYERQDHRSLASVTGLSVTLPFSKEWGVLTAHARGDYLHEFESDSRTILARFVQDAAGYGMSFRTDGPDRDWFVIGGGMVAVLPGGFSAFIDYSGTMGNRLFQEGMLSVGWRAKL